MCNECHQNPCANTCPNNPNFNDEPEMKTCPLCGEQFNAEYFENAVCDLCAYKNATYENALAWGKEEPREVEVNGFLAYVFTESEIEEILLRELEEKGNVLVAGVRNLNAHKYCTEDIGAFADWLVKKKESEPKTYLFDCIGGKRHG